MAGITTQRHAFTLIEVMIAAMLISVVGLSLIQMHQNSAEMSDRMQKKLRYSDWPLMVAFESKLEKVTRNTYFDTLLKSFEIDERSVRNGVKKKVKVSTQLIERINASDISAEIEDESSELKPMFEGFRLEVYKQNMQMDHENYSVYRMIKP